MDGFRSLITNRKTIIGLPPLQGSHVDARELAGWPQACAGCMGVLDLLIYFLAIFQTDQSSASSP
jgi:hypothetical protein